MTGPYCEGVTRARSDDAFETELRRVVTRLQVMPDRLREAAYERTYPVLQALRDITMEFDPAGPRPIPRRAPRAAADQLSVLARDVLNGCDDDQRDRATAQLTALRRSLP